MTRFQRYKRRVQHRDVEEYMFGLAQDEEGKRTPPEYDSDE